MDLDALLYHYFGTVELDAFDADAIATGVDRVEIAFGIEREPGRRFALWTVLHALNRAPDPRVAFKRPHEQQAAEDYMRVAAFAEQPAGD